jgi:sigma-70-like protein
MATGDAGYSNWEAVYRDNVGWVYRMLYAKLGNRPDAEDLTAEVFLAALRPLRLAASVGEVRAYLLATARPRCRGPQPRLPLPHHHVRPVRRAARPSAAARTCPAAPLRNPRGRRRGAGVRPDGGLT